MKAKNGKKRTIERTQSKHSLLPEESGDEALQIMSKEQCQIVISDIEMPGMNGVERKTKH